MWILSQKQPCYPTLAYEFYLKNNLVTQPLHVNSISKTTHSKTLRHCFGKCNLSALQKVKNYPRIEVECYLMFGLFSESNLVLRIMSLFHSLTSLINKPTWWKNSSKQSCIDLILTNHPNFFQGWWSLKWKLLFVNLSWKL